jgi:hypothetical protein
MSSRLFVGGCGTFKHSAQRDGIAGDFAASAASLERIGSGIGLYFSGIPHQQ